MEKELAQKLYEGYFGYTDGKSIVTGDKLPEWNELRESIKNAWRASAKAVTE